ncbi:uncharacterized protein LOC124359544 isoform X3 [Homalodisca vitripennis]|nr:uncharacterized protein LOC124359544 isoform X3 [Homalodisca vitripennis]
MQLVAELSKGMADEYRKKRKGKLKRTFAESSCPTIGNVKDVSETPVKVLITDQNISTNSDYQYSCPKHSELIKQPSYEYSEFSKFILYENCNSFGELQTCPIIILLQSAEKNGFKDSLRFCYPGDSRNSKHEKYCELRFDGKVLSSGTGKSKREAKMNAAIEGLNRLRKTCFTIQEKNVFLSQNLTNIKDGEINTSYPPIPQDNIGSKMMQKMGWTGNGLGKHQQGMQTPIQIMSAKPKQQGFGHWNKMSAKEKFKCFFKKYMTNETSSELIFDPDALSPDDCQIIREANEEEDKRRNEDSMKDLFEEPILEACYNYDSDREEGEIFSDEDTTDIVTTDSSKGSKICIICYRLNSLTGEETEDNIYDIIWGTCSDNTGLKHVMQDNWELKRLILKKKGNGELTDDETCDMEVSDGLQESSDEETKSSIVQSTEYRNTKITAMPPTDLGSPLKEARSVNEISDSFPAPSVGVALKILNSNGILNQYTFSKENIGSLDYLPEDVTQEDLNSCPKLSNNQMVYAFHEKYCSGNKTSASQVLNDIVHSSSSKSNISQLSNIPVNITCDDVLLENLVQITKNNLSKVVEQTITQTSSINNSQRKVVDSSNHTVDTEQSKRNSNDKIKIFLPDGSYKYISLECVKANEELKDIIRYSPEKTADRLKYMVTIEDLKSSKALRKLFSDFLTPPLAISKTATSALSSNCLDINKSKSDYGCDTDTLKNASNDAENSSNKHNPPGALGDQGNLSPTQIKDCKMQKALLEKSETSHESCSAKHTFQESTNIQNHVINNKSLLVAQNNSHIDNSLNHVHTISKNQHQSLPSYKSPNSKFKIFLPDGSFKRVTIKYVKSNPELREFTKYTPYKKITDLNKHVTIEDLKTNKALQNLFADFLPSLQALKENVVKEDASIEITDTTSDESTCSPNNKCSNTYSKNETSSACINSCANEKSSLSTVSTPITCKDQLANAVTEYYKRNHISDQNEKSPKSDVDREDTKPHSIFENIVSTKQFLENFTTNVNSPEKSQEKKVKLFLPDGSYKCITLSSIESNKELSEFTKYTDGKPLSELNNKITAEDLKSNEALHEIFSDFLSTTTFKDDLKSNTPAKQCGQSMPSNINSKLNEAVPSDQICVSSSFPVVQSQSVKESIPDADNVLESEKTIMVKSDSSTNVLNKSVNKDSETGVIGDQTLVLEGPVVESNPDSNMIGRLVHEFNQGRVNPTLVGQEAHPLCVGGRKRGQPKIRFFLPDGSFKRVKVSIVQKHKELNRLVQLDNRNITLEHFKTIPGLRQVFPDFMASYPFLK